MRRALPRCRSVRPRVFDERGLSLIEVLVAALIVGISAVGVALMFGTGQAYVWTEGDSRVALYLAQQKVEQFRSVGYASIGAPASASETVDLTPTGATVLQQYTRSWSVDCVSDTDYSSVVTCPGAKRITVTVQRSPVDPKAVGPVVLDTVLANR